MFYCFWKSEEAKSSKMTAAFATFAVKAIAACPQEVSTVVDEPGGSRAYRNGDV